MSVMVVGMTHASPAVKTLFNPAIDPKIATRIRDLAAPMLKPKSPKDPSAIAEIFHLAQVHEISMSDLPSLTGWTPKVLHHFAQARTTSGRAFPGMREALKRVGIPVKPKAPPKRQIGVSIPWPPPLGTPLTAQPPAVEETPRKVGKKARKKMGKKAAKVAAVMMQEVAQPAAPPVAPPVMAPAPKAPVVSAGNVEIHEDGTITLTLHPGDPGYAETLRGLLSSRVA